MRPIAGSISDAMSSVPTLHALLLAFGELGGTRGGKATNRALS